MAAVTTGRTVRLPVRRTLQNIRLMSAKSALLRLSLAVGAGRVARTLIRGGLQILCYHGISMADEHRYLPKLFIDPETFRRRMQWLVSAGLKVVTLEQGLRWLKSEGMPSGALVITFDDGWHGAHAHAAPVLQGCGFPATLYSTSYYSLKGGMVFDVALRYMLAKSRSGRLALGRLGAGLEGTVDTGDPARRESLYHTLCDIARRQMDAPERQAFLGRIAGGLRLDFEAMCEARMFMLMSIPELQQAEQGPFDIQLHTHRHRSLDRGREVLLTEIRDNRAVLEPLLGKRLTHFCYPSGVVRSSLLPVLAEQGIESAVTCDAGINRLGANPLLLRRFLDGENIPMPVFEAEMTGILELARRVRAFLSR